MIVQESINFERGIDPKRALEVGTYIPGRLFKMKDSYRPKYPNIYILVDTNTKDSKKYRTYFYIGRFVDSKNSLFGQGFSFSGNADSWNVQSIESDRFEPVSLDEERKLNAIFSDPENESTMYKIHQITNIKPILRESVSFQRGGEEKKNPNIQFIKRKI